MPPGALSSLRWGAKGARRGPGHAGRGGVLGGLAGPTAPRSCITAESGQLGPREGHVFMMGPRHSSASRPGLASTPTWIMSLPRVLVTPNNALLAPPLSSVWTSPVDAPPDAARTRPPPGPQAGTRGPFLPGASPAFVSHDGTRRQVLRDKRDTRPPFVAICSHRVHALRRNRSERRLSSSDCRWRGRGRGWRSTRLTGAAGCRPGLLLALRGSKPGARLRAGRPPSPDATVRCVTAAASSSRSASCRKEAEASVINARARCEVRPVSAAPFTADRIPRLPEDGAAPGPVDTVWVRESGRPPAIELLPG